jgi:hypothetical protein
MLARRVNLFKTSLTILKASILGEDWFTRTSARRFNGTFKLPSTYKGPPSKAVDEAWERITPRKWPSGPLAIKFHADTREKFI